MNLTLITDALAADEPVTLTEVKQYLNLGSLTADDLLIQSMITAARQEAENLSGRELAVKTWLLTLDRFPLSSTVSTYPLWPTLGQRTAFWPESSLPVGAIQLLDPVTAITRYEWRDSATGARTALVANTDYIFDPYKHPALVLPGVGKTWPGVDLWPSSGVEIEFTTGMLPADVPSKYKQGIALLVSQWYENRIPFEAIRFAAELPLSVTALFASDKLWKF